MAGFVKPGGQFYIRATHPIFSTLDDQRSDELMTVTLPFFETASPLRWESDQSYAGSANLTNTINY